MTWQQAKQNRVSLFRQWSSGIRACNWTRPPPIAAERLSSCLAMNSETCSVLTTGGRIVLGDCSEVMWGLHKATFLLLAKSRLPRFLGQMHLQAKAGIRRYAATYVHACMQYGFRICSAVVRSKSTTGSNTFYSSCIRLRLLDNLGR